MDDEVTSVLKEMNVDPMIIPGGCTGKIQTLDVSVNHPFKLYIQEEFDAFMEDKTQHTFTAKGNMRAPSKTQLCDMALRALSKITPEVVMKSFLVCGQSPHSRVEDIQCFKDGKECAEGREKLQKLMNADINKVDINLIDIVEDDHHLLSIMTDHDIKQQEMPKLDDPVVVMDCNPDENPLADLDDYYD